MKEMERQIQEEQMLYRRLLQDRAARQGVPFDMVGSCESFRVLVKQLRAAAANREPVLLVGERGSGKEVAARALHLWSTRHSMPFLPIFVPALCEDLLADELFGHERHSFTGALHARPGRFAAAHGGTVFLDEIGDLSATAQAALLRVLETGEITRIGEDLPQRIDVRIVAATNQDLDRLIAEGRFRADLRDRLGVFQIKVPPLRDHRADIPALASYFLGECCMNEACPFGNADRSACRKMAKVACAGDVFLQGLTSYDWPGNVRELRSDMIRARAAHPRAFLQAEHLPESIRPAGSSAGLEQPARDQADMSLEAVMRRHINAVLALEKNNISRAARKLGLLRSTLRDKMKKLGIVIR